ncbi:hypothetical protein QEN19_002614 [Hanseniaspora menglaensis]
MSSSVGSVVLQGHGSYVPLSLIAKNLEQCSVNELEFFLYNLRSNNYITQDVTLNDYTVLVNKLIKMLNGQSVFDSWKALQVTNVLFAYNPVVLCSFSKTMIKELGNKLEFMFKKNRLNSSSTSVEFFKSLIFSINNLVKLLREKPILKREVLTPNLAPIIKILTNKLPEVFDVKLLEIFVDFLKELLVNNTSVFKPYVTKYHSYLQSKLADETYLQSKFIENFVLCHLINLNYQTSSEKNSGNNADNKHIKSNLSQDQWNNMIHSIFVEIKKVLSLYEDILDIDEYTKSIIKQLPSEETENESVFDFLPLLKLDLNEANTLFQINARITLFVEILNKFITLPTTFQIKLNSQSIIDVCNILVSLQNFKLMKGLRKDTNVISCLSLNLISLAYDSGLSLFGSLLSLKNGVHMLPFSKKLLIILQNFLVPLYNNASKNKTFNLNKVMTQKLNLIKLFSFLSDLCLSNSGLLISKLQKEDLEIWNEFLNLAITLLKEDQSLYYKLQSYTNTINDIKNGSGSKKKSNLLKKTDTISDIYTVPNAFCSSNVLQPLSDVLFKFLIESIKYIRITTSVRSLIEKQAIVDSNQDLMKWLVINPSLESSNQSILPIVASLSNSDIKEWLRSTVISKLPQNFIQQHIQSTIDNHNESDVVEENDMWIEQNSEEAEEIKDEDIKEEPPLKKQKLSGPVYEENKIEESEKEIKTVEHIAPLIIDTAIEVVEKVEIVQTQNESDIEESDLEIPELDLS